MTAKPVAYQKKRLVVRVNNIADVRGLRVETRAGHVRGLRAEIPAGLARGPKAETRTGLVAGRRVETPAALEEVGRGVEVGRGGEVSPQAYAEAGVVTTVKSE